MGQHTLVLFRHAKSDWSSGLPDHARALAERGRRDAPVAGRWIADHVGPVDRVVVSTATRTQQTWDRAAPFIELTGERQDEPDVYEASCDDLLRIVRALPESDRVVVLVGHNPGLEDLADLLAGADPSEMAQGMRVKYPTSGIAVFQLDADWGDLPARATLLSFAVPRG